MCVEVGKKVRMLMDVRNLSSSVRNCYILVWHLVNCLVVLGKKRIFYCIKYKDAENVLNSDKDTSVAGYLSAKKCILVAIQEFVQNEINLSFHVISSETLILSLLNKTKKVVAKWWQPCEVNTRKIIIVICYQSRNEISKFLFPVFMI